MRTKTRRGIEQRRGRLGGRRRDRGLRTGPTWTNTMAELRHRVGQRPSESTGEGGYAQQQSGAYHQQQPSNYGNAGYYQGGSGGYPAAGGGSSGYSYGSQQAPGAPSQAPYGQQTQQAVYGGAYGQQQAYQSSGGGYSNTGNNSGSSYGGSYGGYANNSGLAANMNSGANPYQKSSKSSNGSGFTFKHIVFSILSLILIALIGSTVWTRNTLLVKQVALDSARRTMEEQQESINSDRQGGRFGQGRTDQQKKKAERKNRKKQVHPKQKQFINKKMSDDLAKEIQSLKTQLEEQQAAHADLTKQQTSSGGNLDDLLRKKQDVVRMHLAPPSSRSGSFLTLDTSPAQVPRPRTV